MQKLEDKVCFEAKTSFLYYEFEAGSKVLENRLNI
jgi:hypothetical protein